MNLNDVVITGGARLPIGRFGGSLREFKVYDLGAKAIEAAVARSGAAPEDIDEVFVAHNRQSGNGPNPGRTAAVFGGIPKNVPAHTINMACPAGLRATVEAAQALQLGQIGAAVVCGMESMSTIPPHPTERPVADLSHRQHCYRGRVLFGSRAPVWPERLGPCRKNCREVWNFPG